jgi:UDP-N-acetylglucosamine transferase subunit ALG13
MVLITLGSQKFQFNRLLIAIDDLIQNNIITVPVFAQIGYSGYQPNYFEHAQFLARTEFVKKANESKVVITHGGTGAIITAIKNNCKVIAVPRMVHFGEHVDDHQVQIVEQFDEMGIIKPCYQLSDLGEIYTKLDSQTFKTYKSNSKDIIKSISDFIN